MEKINSRKSFTKEYRACHSKYHHSIVFNGQTFSGSLSPQALVTLRNDLVIYWFYCLTSLLEQNFPESRNLFCLVHHYFPELCVQNMAQRAHMRKMVWMTEWMNEIWLVSRDIQSSKVSVFPENRYVSRYSKPLLHSVLKRKQQKQLCNRREATQPQDSFLICTIRDGIGWWPKSLLTLQFQDSVTWGKCRDISESSGYKMSLSTPGKFQSGHLQHEDINYTSWPCNASPSLGMCQGYDRKT